MKIYLCRHGQTTGDIEDRYGGDYDDHLTELGKTQAKELANKLQGKGIEKIFVSPKIRALETSEILNQTLNVKRETIENLRERNQNGILTGMIRAEAKLKYPELAEKVRDYRNTIDGAEDYESFSKRVLAALQEVTVKPLKVVAIVTHGGPIKAILRSIYYSSDYKIEDCAFAELETEGDKIKVIGLDGIEPR